MSAGVRKYCLGGFAQVAFLFSPYGKHQWIRLDFKFPCLHSDDAALAAICQPAADGYSLNGQKW
jgi:hypothetical protein